MGEGTVTTQDTPASLDAATTGPGPQSDPQDGPQIDPQARPDVEAQSDPDAGPRVVFVLGTGRCGSTLVQEILARHPEMSFVSNVEDRLASVRLSGRVAASVYPRLPMRVSGKGRGRLYPSEGYRVLAEQVSPILASPVRDLLADDATPWLSARLREFFERHARAQGRPVVLHKFTGWPRARFLAAVFPQARFVHVVRDGRAVANSWLQMPWWQGWNGPDGWGYGHLSDPARKAWEDSGQNFAVLAGLQWALLLDAFEEAREEIAPDRWLELRYEDVVAAPRESFARMLDFAGSPWTPSFERAFTRYRFEDARSTAFRTDLDPHTVERLDRAIGPTLERYGYSL